MYARVRMNVRKCVYRKNERRVSIERRLFFDSSKHPESRGGLCQASNEFVATRGHFSHRHRSICRFKYICSHLNAPFSDNLCAKPRPRKRYDRSKHVLLQVKQFFSPLNPSASIDAVRCRACDVWTRYHAFR